MTLLRFLGSIYFAIALIVATLLFVIAGTFLESLTDSHLFAARMVYSNPIFLALLWGYFINILFSSLLRYPFKTKHIPFLITHLGLLMIFAGALVKGHFGSQGMISLVEGTSTDRILLPNTYALHLETRRGSMTIPLKPRKLGPLALDIPDLSISVLDWKEHVEERIDGWMHEDKAYLFGFPPLPVYPWKEGQLPLSLKTADYTLAALKSDALDEIAKRLSLSSVALVQNSQNETFLLAKNNENQTFKQKLEDDLIVVFDHGYRGYGYAASLPPTFPDLDLITPLLRTATQKKPPLKKEDSKAQIALRISTPSRTEIVELAYDRFAQGLKWPACENYLLRFQPMIKSIPAQLRLKQTRQINYPNSNQPFSYESDLWVNGEEITISMNHVHETKEGYRFYMAGIVHRPYAKAAQIAVNRNPARYILTYSGACILTVGMLLLYLKRLYV